MGEDELKLPLDEVKALESSWDDTPMPRPKPKGLRDTGETEFDFRMPGGPSRLIDQIADELGPGQRPNSLRHPPAPKAPPPPPPPTPPIGLNSPAGLPPPRMVPPLPPAPPPGWASRVAPAAPPPPAQPIGEEATAPAPLLDGLELPPTPAPATVNFRLAPTPPPPATPPSFRLGPPPPPPGPTPPPPPHMPPELTPAQGAWSAGGPPTPSLGLEGLVIGPPIAAPPPAPAAPRPFAVPGLSAIPAPSPPPPPLDRPTPPIALETIGLAELKMPDRPLAPPIAPDRPTVLIDGQAAALDHAIASSFNGGPERSSAPRAPTAPPPAPPPTPAFGIPAEGLDEQQVARIIVGTPSPNATPLELKRIDLAADLRDLVPAARIGTQRPLPMPSAPLPQRSAPPVPPLPMPGANPSWWRPFVLGVGVASLLWLLLKWLS